MIRSTLVSLFGLLLAVPAGAQTSVAWPAELPPGVELAEPTEEMPHPHLVVSNDGESPRTWTIAVVDDPALEAHAYAVTGRVRYEDVAPGGYLEMWSHFPDGQAYFTRTLATRGPMRALEGSAGWRAFSLPFRSSPEVGFPSRLVVNVVLPGRGTVAVGPMTLDETSTPRETPSPSRRE